MKFLMLLMAMLVLSIGTLYSQNLIADHTVAKESVLRSIPHSYIAAAKSDYHIVYQHTSHGTHVACGVFGLPDYKSGDDTLFAVENSGTPQSGKLHFMDCYSAPTSKRLKSYSVSGADASDLSRNETAFIQATKNFLDSSANDEVNVIMWSWCSIRSHDVANNYIPGMDSLIAEYGSGGTNSRATNNPVTFIFFTGHAEAGNNIGDGKAANQAKLITDHCKANGYYCLDYFGIDAHAVDDTYYDDASDNGTSSSYGGSFYSDWQTSHTLGEDWYENKATPGGSVNYGSHLSQHITSNRKAYAMWWILAKMAGWDSDLTSSDKALTFNNMYSPISMFTIEKNRITVSFNSSLNINANMFNVAGKKVASFSGSAKENWNISTDNFSTGVYYLNVISNGFDNLTRKIVLNKSF